MTPLLLLLLLLLRLRVGWRLLELVGPSNGGSPGLVGT
jgi:hypothetical protein